jgi:TRAP-type C4-dicarboxylate transport system permease small subunit
MSSQGTWQRILQVNRLLALVGFCGLLLLALMTSLDVLARWMLNQPLHGVNDLSAIALAVIIAACLPANLAERQNITVEILGNSLGGRSKACLDAFGSFATLVFVTLMTWRFVLYSQEIASSGQTTWVLKLPIAPAWWIATGFLILSIPTQLMVLGSDLKRAWQGPAPNDDDGGETALPSL